MFSEDEKNLLDFVIKSDFYGAVGFALSVKRQGFMSKKQKQALINMKNSIRPWSSRSSGKRKGLCYDHDDLAEGWDGL